MIATKEGGEGGQGSRGYTGNDEGDGARGKSPGSAGTASTQQVHGEENNKETTYPYNYQGMDEVRNSNYRNDTP